MHCTLIIKHILPRFHIAPHLFPEIITYRHTCFHIVPGAILRVFHIVMRRIQCAQYVILLQPITKSILFCCGENDDNEDRYKLIYFHIMVGGITPKSQPLKLFLGKVMKFILRDLYHTYTLNARVKGCFCVGESARGLSKKSLDCWELQNFRRITIMP